MGLLALQLVERLEQQVLRNVRSDDEEDGSGKEILIVLAILAFIQYKTEGHF